MQHHEVIEQFLQIIGADEADLARDTERIESSISFYTIERIASFNQYFIQDESRLQSFYQSCFK
jgi:Mn-dependent DtxR family transcriptional regulator